MYKIRKKIMIYSWENLVKNGRTDGRTDIGCCPTNVERHITKQAPNWTLKKLKLESHLPEKYCIIYLIESPSNMMKNAFYLILKGSFRSQDTQVFVMTFWSCRKDSLIRKRRLNSEFMASHPGQLMEYNKWNIFF